MSLSLLTDCVSSEQPGGVRGAPLLGSAKRTLDSEDCSKTMAEEGEAEEYLVKGHVPKMAHRVSPYTLCNGSGRKLRSMVDKAAARSLLLQ